MKEKWVSMFWGIVLVLIGGWFLVTRSTSFTIRDPYWGLALMGGLSALFFISYFLTRRWGWLFPAYILAGTTVVGLLGLAPGADGGWMAAPVLLSIAAPFLVRYFQDRKAHRWALIPVYVLTALTLVTAVADLLQGELAATLILLMIALPFLAVYLTNRERRWALIPFGVLAVISLIPLLTTLFTDDMVAVAILFVLAAPFVVVYFASPRGWWGLIPAGILVTSGVVVWMTMTFWLDPAREQQAQHIVGGAFFLGFSLTFLVLWLRRHSIPTAWAIIPAGVLALLSAITFIGGEQGLTSAWPVAIIAGGLLMLFKAYRSKLA